MDLKHVDRQFVSENNKVTYVTINLKLMTAHLKLS